MVIPSGGHVSRQEKLGAVVGAPVGKRHGGKQRDPAQINLMPLLKHSCQLRRTRRAIALANQKFWRSPAIIARDVLVDEIGEPVGIRDDPVELIGSLTGRGPAEARGDSINENKIGSVEERILI